MTSEIIQTIHSIHHSSNSTWAMVFSLLACVEEAQRSLPFAGKSGFCILPPVLILTVKGCYGCCHLFRTSLSRQAEGWKWLKIKSHRTATLNIKVQAHPRQTRRSHLGCASGRCVGVCMWGSICFPKHHCGHIYTSPLIDLFRWLLYNFGLLLLRFRTVFFKGSLTKSLLTFSCHGESSMCQVQPAWLFELPDAMRLLVSSSANHMKRIWRRWACCESWRSSSLFCNFVQSCTSRPCFWRSLLVSSDNCF